MSIGKPPTSLEEDILPHVRKIAWVTFVVAFLLSIALLVLRIFPLVYGQGSIPLHYNIYVGIDAFGAWWMLLATPITGMGIAIINALLAHTLLKRKPMMVIALWGITFFVSCVMVCAVVCIALINLAYG